MWILFAIPFAINTFVMIPPIHRFLNRMLQRYAPGPIIDHFTALAITIVSILALTLLPTGLGLWFLPLMLFSASLPPVFSGIFNFFRASQDLSAISSRIGFVLLSAFLSIVFSVFVAIGAFIVYILKCLSNPLQSLYSIATSLVLCMGVPILILDKLLLDIRSIFDINAKQLIGGDTILIAAAYEGNDVAITHLLQKNPQVNAQNKQGNTALHFIIGAPDVSIEKKIAIINALLAAGANTQIINHAGKTPVEMIETISNYREIQTLIQLFEGQNVSIPVTVTRHQTRLQNEALNNAESIWNTRSITESVNKAVIALQARYKGINIKQTLNTVKAEFETQAALLKTPEEKRWIAPARKALENIIAKKFDATLGRPMDSDLAYIWMGVCDKNCVKDRTLSDEEISNRKKQFIQHLYECQRGKNLDINGVDDNAPIDRPICFSGHLRKMVSVLWHQHDDVKLIYITSEILSLKTRQLFLEKFRALNQSEQDKFLPAWKAGGSVPDELLTILKPKVAAALHEEFDPYKDFLQEKNRTYEETLKQNLDALKWVTSPPPAVVGTLKKVASVIGMPLQEKSQKDFNNPSLNTANASRMAAAVSKSRS